MPKNFISYCFFIIIQYSEKSLAGHDPKDLILERQQKKQILQQKGIFTIGDNDRCALFTTRESRESRKERTYREKKKRKKKSEQRLNHWLFFSNLKNADSTENFTQMTRGNHFRNLYSHLVFFIPSASLQRACIPWTQYQKNTIKL